VNVKKDAGQIQASITVHNCFQFNSHYEPLSISEPEPHRSPENTILEQLTNIYGSPIFPFFHVSCLNLSEIAIPIQNTDLIEQE